MRLSEDTDGERFSLFNYARKIKCGYLLQEWPDNLIS